MYIRTYMHTYVRTYVCAYVRAGVRTYVRAACMYVGVYVHTDENPCTHGCGWASLCWTPDATNSLKRVTHLICVFRSTHMPFPLALFSELSSWR